MKALPALLCLTLPCLPAIAKDEQPPQRDLAWVDEQLATWNLTREDAPPFRLAATLEVLDEGKWVTGTYALTGFRRASGAKTSASPDTRKPKAWQEPSAGGSDPRATGPVFCGCSPPSSGAIASPQQSRRSFARPTPGKGSPRRQEIYGTTVTFDAPATFPLRSWPATYRARELGREIGRAKIEMLAPLAPTAEVEFLPPREAVQVPGCGAPTAPRPTHEPFPPYPASLVAQRVEGTVHVRATVAADGTVQDAEVLRTPNRDLAKLALETVRTWRYDPAKCGERAVPVEMWARVDWKMGTSIPK